jgi:hypothetical protein
MNVVVGGAAIGKLLITFPRRLLLLEGRGKICIYSKAPAASLNF